MTLEILAGVLAALASATAAAISARRLRNEPIAASDSEVRAVEDAHERLLARALVEQRAVRARLKALNARLEAVEIARAHAATKRARQAHTVPVTQVRDAIRREVDALEAANDDLQAAAKQLRKELPAEA